MIDTEDHNIKIEVVYAHTQDVELIPLDVKIGTTAMEAIELSGIKSKYPSIDFTVNKIGIFGRQCQGDTMLNEGDRVEIYRPLLTDPKKARRRRASAQGS